MFSADLPASSLQYPHGPVNYLCSPRLAKKGPTPRPCHDRPAVKPRPQPSTRPPAAQKPQGKIPQTISVNLSSITLWRHRPLANVWPRAASRSPLQERLLQERRPATPKCLCLGSSWRTLKMRSMCCVQGLPVENTNMPSIMEKAETLKFCRNIRC